MPNATIRVRANGPYLVAGDIEILDAAGKPFSITPGKTIALCRCGQSGGKPFCDGTHNRCGFKAEETAG